MGQTILGRRFFGAKTPAINIQPLTHPIAENPHKKDKEARDDGEPNPIAEQKGQSSDNFDDGESYCKKRQQGFRRQIPVRNRTGKGLWIKYLESACVDKKAPDNYPDDQRKPWRGQQFLR